MIDEESACREVVFNFCSALNEWERKYSILNRTEEGKFVSQKERDAVAGVTKQEHLDTHARLFAQHVVPRVRKYGSNPGEPKSWGWQGTYANVSLATIRSVSFRGSRAEVITGWGYMLPGGQTMFVLKRKDNRWLIDSLKTKLGEKWETAHL
jgi:hypothetical protein